MSENSKNYIYDCISEKYGETMIQNFPKIANHISDFINKRSDVLQTRNVGKRLLYTKTQENEFFEVSGIDRDEIVKIVSSSPNIPYKYQDEKEPLYNILLVMSSFYEAHQKDMEKLYGTRIKAFYFVRMYLAMRIYSICQRQIFKYEADEKIMEYTINNSLNNKFVISKVENIYKFIEYFMEHCNNGLNVVDFKYIKDVEIYKYNSDLIHRYKDTLKQIYRRFDENHEQKKTTITEQIQLQNEEGKTYMTVTASISNTIEIKCTTILQAFIQDGIKLNLVNIACKKCNNISREKTTMLLNSMKNSNDNKLLTSIIKDVLSYWVISLKQSVESIHSMNFIKKCSSAYSISNAYDVFISDLKLRLNDIIFKYGSDYIDTEKKTTLNSFKQAVYLYLVFYISSLD